MNGLTFQAPSRLWALLAVAALGLAYVFAQRRRSRYALRLPGLHLLGVDLPRLGWRRHVAGILLLLAAVASTTAFAVPSASGKVPRDRATVIVALDVSLSMAASDVSPNRITAAKQAARAFIDGLPDRFNVGLVAFSGSAAVVIPASQNHAEVAAAVDGLQLGAGTAIGEAVFASLQAVADVPAATGANGADAAPAHVVLLSDGTNTAGRSVQDAAQAAVASHVPVSTIAYGTQEGTVEVQGQLVNVPVDAAALAQLATAAGGKAYAAASGSELSGVYDSIGSQVGFTTQQRRVASAFAGLALFAAAGAIGAALTWSPRLL